MEQTHGSGIIDEAEPEQVVEAAAVDPDPPAKAPAPKKPQYPYPRRTLEDALRVPSAIRTHNGGNPWAPSEVAKALRVSGKTGSYFYLTTASRDFGLTEGSRDSETISLTPLGKQAVYPTSDEAADEARLKAFLNVEKFRQVVEHYGGSKLPTDEFVRNTLETQFNLDPRTHTDFIDLFKKNCKFVGIGTEWNGTVSAATTSNNGAGTKAASNGVVTPAILAKPFPTLMDGERPICFVIMPFVEKTDDNAPGFFNEVFASLFKPAIEAAGFEAKTAKRQGSDVIQATIINELLDSHLVLCDLTEHNPNVLFELWLRMAGEKPIAIVKATGTNPIFDVDHLLRVESYNPNLWPSTAEKDVPKLTAHIKEAWATRETGRSYMSILRHVAAPVG
ncbi:MAG: hypothetical protein ACRDRI_16265 [Pseudonocardiaceae bacterium]